jgi:acetyl esterase
MRLWSDEIEAMRPEARTVVSAGLAAIVSTFRDDAPPPVDLGERVQSQRAAMAQTYAADPEGEETEIAGVRCLVYRPEAPATAIYLHFHGGGMIVGKPEMNDAANLDLSRRFGLAVVSVDYRLAPEHPYPAGPDDGIAVARWLLDNGDREFGSERILTGGESAGGYMAAAVLLRIRDELGAIDRVDGANLVFGVYDWGGSPSQRGVRPLEAPDMLTVDGCRFFTECYLPDRTDDERRDPAISPAFADLRGLPPALMSVGTCDHLLDDTLLLASRWAAANRNVDLFVAPDMPHGFGAFPCGISAAWNDTTRAWFTTRLARP